MCRLSWFLDPGGWSKTTVVGLYFIFPGICTLSLSTCERKKRYIKFVVSAAVKAMLSSMACHATGGHVEVCVGGCVTSVVHALARNHMEVHVAFFFNIQYESKDCRIKVFSLPYKNALSVGLNLSTSEGRHNLTISKDVGSGLNNIPVSLMKALLYSNLYELHCA
ncbi:hypothetical protein STEG23_019311, partial [Scotinomys teguina]